MKSNFLGYSQKVVRTNETVRLETITKHFPYSREKFINPICTFFDQLWHKFFGKLLGDTVSKVCTSPRNSTWFTRLLFLMRGWVWRRDYKYSIAVYKGHSHACVCFGWTIILNESVINDKNMYSTNVKVQQFCLLLQSCSHIQNHLHQLQYPQGY